jgi:NADPH2:quinone reductase
LLRAVCYIDFNQISPKEQSMSALPSVAPAIVLTGQGGTETMKLADIPLPEIGPDDVMIRIQAAGVNRADAVQRQGGYPPPPGESEILGLEVAGTIAAVGDNVSQYAPGDEVCALLAGGGYATYCRVNVAQVLPIPKGYSMVQAAALPEVFFTVWTNVFDLGRLQEGETFLVHGGSSGIGTAAIMLAKHRGATVITTAGSAEKCAACEALGATRAINYKQEDFVDVIANELDMKIDVVLDMVGGDYMQRDLGLMNPGGRHVSIAFLAGPMSNISVIDIMMKRLTVTGSTLRARPVEFKGTVAQSVYDHVWPALEAGAFEPVIDSTFPLAKAAEAHHLIESSAHIGKIILTVD